MKNKIFFAGDFLISHGINNYKIIDEKLQKKIDECDIVCCNYEGPIVVDTQAKKKKIGPNINNNKENAEKLIKSNFNLFCLANNHIFDYGIEGITNTINFFKERNVKYIGANIDTEEIYQEFIKKINGIKVGIINVAENGFGAAIENEEYGYAYMFNKRAINKIKEVRQQVDKLILVVHAGAEHWDIPLQEIRDSYKMFIDMGVDIIIGHHPHVPQGIEQYKNGLIVYSLGNFAFDRGQGPLNNHTYSIIITLLNDNTFEYELVPITFDNNVISIDTSSQNVLEGKFEKLCAILENNEQYKEEMNRNCITYYEYYKGTYSRIFCIYKGSIKERMKGFIKKYILRQKFQDIWLYHNINIETHLWICKRATRLILKQKNIL